MNAIVVLKNWARFTGEHLSRDFFLNKVVGLQCSLIIKTETPTQMFSHDVLRTPFLQNITGWLFLSKSKAQIKDLMFPLSKEVQLKRSWLSLAHLIFINCQFYYSKWRWIKWNKIKQDETWQDESNENFRIKFLQLFTYGKNMIFYLIYK